MELYYPLALDLVTEWPGPRGKNWHYGTDFGVPVGTPIPSSCGGVVVFAGGDGASGELYYPGSGIWANGEALVVDVRRADGLIVRYIHLSRIDVAVGQQVTAGQQLGLSGNTGWSLGPHLHWELRWDRLWAGGKWAYPQDLGAIPFPPKSLAPAGQEEDDDMSRPLAIAKTIKGSTVEVTVCWPETGEEHTFQSTNDKAGISYNQNVALAYGCAPQCPIIYITESHYNKIKSENAATRKRLSV